MSFFKRRRRRLVAQLLAAAVTLGLSVQPCFAAPGWGVQADTHHGTEPDSCCFHSALLDRHIGKPLAATLAEGTPAAAPMTGAAALPWEAPLTYWSPGAGPAPAPALPLYLRLERLLI